VNDKPQGRASYDKEAGAIGVYFKPDGVEYESSEEIAPGVVLDYDTQGRVIGVKLRNVRKLLAEGPLSHAAAPMADKPSAIHRGFLQFSGPFSDLSPLLSPFGSADTGVDLDRLHPPSSLSDLSF
jgi:uncharacterized protein YuzE